MNAAQVNYFELVPDGCNFADSLFERSVDSFMERLMPCFPLDLLGEAGQHWAYEEWEFIASEDYTVVSLSQQSGADYMPDGVEGFIVIDKCGAHTDPEAELSSGGYPYPDGNTPHGIPYWLDEDEAQEAADQLNLKESEPSLAFPWASNRAFVPDDRISDSELTSAGFIVAEFRGHRLAGIDGCGYSFKGGHFAKLCGIVYANRAEYNWTVDTKDGPRTVRMGGGQ